MTGINGDDLQQMMFLKSCHELEENKDKIAEHVNIVDAITIIISERYSSKS
jgi:hypothetical protein